MRTVQLKRGRQMSYSRSLVVDADRPDRVLAVTEGQGAAIGVPPEGLPKMDTRPIEVVDSPDLPPLWQVFGAERRADGRWALPPLADDVASPDGALHLGPQFVLLETAARDSLGGGALEGVSSHVMFLARGKVGPFRAQVEPIEGAGATVGVRALLHDEGAGDRVVTAASYLFRSTSP